MRLRSNCFLLPLAAIAASATPAVAQCLSASGTTVTLSPTLPPTAANDEGRSSPLPLGFAFPMTGAVSATFTHVVVDANGALYLTNGGPAVGAVDFGPQNGLDDLRGLPGDSPRVFPMWNDVEGIAPSWSVRVDTTVAGICKVTWNDVELVGSGGPQYSCSATLFDTGVVELAYGPLQDDLYGWAGVSVGNGVGTGFEVGDDLVAGVDSGALGLLFGEFFGFDRPPVSGKAITLTPNGLGGYVSAMTCRSSEHLSLGEGCYLYQEANQAMYQLFPNVAASAAALPGTAIQFLIAGTGYIVVPASQPFIPPSPAAVTLTLADDASVTYAPSIPFPHANGISYAQLAICSNGFVSMAPAGVNPSGTGGSVSSLLNAPAPSFRSQRDYNPSIPASGKVKREEVLLGGEQVLVVTWDNVYIYNSTAAERFQIQLNLVTGTVSMVWDVMATVTPQTRALLVGCAPGPSLNPGSISLANDLPVVTTPDVNLQPLNLSVVGEPINNGTPPLYTISNIPEFFPGTGIHGAAIVFGFTSYLPTGLDLGLPPLDIGAPGCNAYQSQDVTIILGNVGAPSVTFPIAWSLPSVPAGPAWMQAVAQFFPGSLPNGLNAGGYLTSNTLEIFINGF